MRYPPLPAGRRTVAALLGSLALGACAYRVPVVSPADIPALEQRIAADTADTDLQVRLGMAQYQAKAYDSALVTLRHAVHEGNRSGSAYLYLGLTQEHFRHWAEARKAYNEYLAVGTSKPVKQELRKRLVLIAHKVLAEQARQALAQEARLSAKPPTPHTVAVLPFAFNSNRKDLEPLVYALSAMMTTDFSLSGAVTVLERARIQTLLNEMALTQAGYADPTTGARAGRLLQAANVVQGVITTVGKNGIRLDADVLRTASASSEGRESVENQLSKLFDVEKQLVFRTLRDVLHVQLTPAEEQAIRNDRADNLLAFLAYGRGLRDRDQGRYAAALQQFQQATRLDPGYRAATDATSSTRDMEAASVGGTRSVTEVATGGGSVVGPAGGAGGQFGTGSMTRDAMVGASDAVNPTPSSGVLDQGSTQGSGTSGSENSGHRKNPVQESQGQPGVTNTSTAQINIVIKRPGGAP